MGDASQIRRLMAELAPLPTAVIAWHKHSFIKRLLAFSLQEVRFYACLAAGSQ